jgi:hypothetical protein
MSAATPGRPKARRIPAGDRQRYTAGEGLA